MTDMNKINETELTNVAGGNGAPGQCLHLAQPCVQSGYLALRSQPCWDHSRAYRAVTWHFAASRAGMTATRSARSIPETDSM